MVELDERADPDMEIRLPVSGRVLQLALGGLGAWIALIVTISLAGRGTLWALLAGVALVIWVAYFYRLLTIAVVLRGDDLTVRNLLRTSRLTRSEVAEVTLGQSSMAKAPNQTVVIRTSRDQTVYLDACARTVQSQRKRRRVEDYQHRLTEWSEHVSPPETLELQADQAPPVPEASQGVAG